MTTLDGLSVDLDQERREQAQQLFPELFSEGKLDPLQLKRYFGEHYATEEGYGITRAGKNNAIQVINQRTSKTLHPDQENSIDWDSTENLLIEGDNLDALRILQKSYYNKIKMIYIDPPYNTGNDNFVYPDDFSQTEKEYLEASGQLDAEGNIKKTSFWQANTKDSGKYHSNWLSMMYPRLYLARNLLKDDGVIFVSIDDHEVHNLRLMMNEVFGENNFIAQLIWDKQHSQQQGIYKKYHEYCVVYSKNIEKQNNIEGGDGVIVAGALKKISKVNPASDFLFPSGTRIDAKDGTTFVGTYGGSEKVTVVRGDFIVEDNKLKEDVLLSAGWTQKNQMISWFSGKDTYDTKGQKILEFFFNSAGKLKCTKDRTKITPSTILPKFGMVSESTDALRKIMGGHFFDNPKPVDMLILFTKWFLKPNDIVLDFFAGSGTTAHAVMQLNAEDGGNRKYILVQYPELTDENSEAYKAGYESIPQITRERIDRVGKKIKEEMGEKADSLDTGFKSFVIGESNFKIWRPEHINDQTLMGQLELFTNNTKEGVESLYMIYELILKRGIDLNTKVTAQEFEGYSYYYLGEGELVICLEEKVNQNLIDYIVRLEPVMVVMLDKGFAENDQLLVNTDLQMKAKGITFQTL